MDRVFRYILLGSIFIILWSEGSYAYVVGNYESGIPMKLISILSGFWIVRLAYRDGVEDANKKFKRN